jgi:hypothetical protein
MMASRVVAACGTGIRITRTATYADTRTVRPARSVRIATSTSSRPTSSRLRDLHGSTWSPVVQHGQDTVGQIPVRSSFRPGYWRNPRLDPLRGILPTAGEDHIP